MGVLFQAFYWNCPAEENQDGTWWNFVTSKVLELQQAGITALWLPPACKAADLGGPVATCVAVRNTRMWPICGSQSSRATCTAVRHGRVLPGG